MLCP
jgi:hypothetical protein